MLSYIILCKVRNQNVFYNILFSNKNYNFLKANYFSIYFFKIEIRTEKVFKGFTLIHLLILSLKYLFYIVSNYVTEAT